MWVQKSPILQIESAALTPSNRILFGKLLFCLIPQESQGKKTSPGPAYLQIHYEMSTKTVDIKICVGIFEWSAFWRFLATSEQSLRSVLENAVILRAKNCPKSHLSDCRVKIKFPRGF